jgi:hypothetical protein
MATENNNLEIVQAALGGDPVETERLFTDRMNAEVSKRVENMRPAVAAHLLTPQEPSANETDSE